MRLLRLTALCSLATLALLATGGESRAQAFLPLDPAKAITQYNLDVWNEGLPQNSIQAIAQTQGGYLWLGTQEGLVRFDGLRFTVYDKRNSPLSNNNVVALAEGRGGALWIGTRGGGLTHLAGGRFTSYTTGKDGLASDKISALVEDRRGALWIGTYDEGLDHLVDGRVTHFDTASGFPSNSISALYAERSGTLWVGTRDRGLVRIQDGKVRLYTGADGLPSHEIKALLVGQDGTLWVGTEEGLSRLRNGRFETLTVADGLPNNSIRALYEDHAGSLWIGTFRGGLVRYREGRFSTFSIEDGLSHDVVRVLHGDREGSLWIGTDSGGLNRLRDGKFTTYTTKEGLVHDIATTVYEDAEGAVWIGTESGLSRLRNGTFTTFTTKDGLSSDFVTSIQEDGDGVLWVGTYDKGVNRFADGRFTSYTTDDGLPSNSINALYRDSRGDLWIGTFRGGLVRYRAGVFTTYTTAHGLTSNDVQVIVEEAPGKLLVGTYNRGLNHFSGGRVTSTITAKDGLLNDFVLSIYVDKDRTVWFSTREGGLYRMKGGDLTLYTVKEGLHNETIMSILEDDAGYLWLSSNRGLFRIAKQELEAFARGERTSVTSIVYGRGDGLKGEQFYGGIEPAAWKGRDGTLWFPSDGGGVVSIAPSRLRLNEQPPIVIIEGATANGEPISREAEAHLSPGKDKFEFHYVGLSFLASEKVRYRYKLEGVDSDWVEAGTRREAYYTNLPPGRYTFQVMAANGDGVWSPEPATVTFYLKPFFYQTPLFYAVCVLVLLLGGFGAYRLRVRHLTARQRELERIVDERTHDLRVAKEKTEDALQEAQHQRTKAEEAKAVIEEQADRLREMDRIKTRFFSNISHEFRTPLTLNIGPLENALTGLYGSVSDEMRRQLEVMLRNSRRLLRLINQLLDLSKLESGKMKLNIRRGNLVGLLEGVVLSFTAFAEKKRLRLEFTPGEEDLLLFFDPECLEKVFFNLLSNAVKFTPEEGAITVAVRRGVTDHLGAPHEAIEVRVRDTGRGIPARELPYIFDRFHQVDGVISEVQEGTGIGLSLVKELVELHGGSIAVTSGVGMGTEFLIVLPTGLEHFQHANINIVQKEEFDLPQVSRGPMVEMAVFDTDDTGEGDGWAGDGHTGAPADPAEDAGPRLPILLAVDDNPDIRDYMLSCLKGAFRVVTARDGVEGLEKARRVGPDLIISDVMMPRMDGYELSRALRADPALMHIPLVLLTSKASVDDRVEGLEAGADDYLAKPFNAKELLARVNNLLLLRQHQRDLKDVNAELRETNDELREVSEMKSQLLQIAAHDLKNPLNGIREFAKVIKEEIEDDSPFVELLDLIFNAADQMLHMITQLLESEALESGKIILRKQPVSARLLAEKVVQRFRKQAERKGQQLLLVADHGDALIEADTERLQEAIDNLVSNAIKYSPLNRPIWISLLYAGGEVLLTVRDEGPGFSEEDKTKLFERFQRLSARPTGGESSTGLGLSIVKQIVEMHDGRVWADSALGAGSTFTIALARYAETPTAEVVEIQ